MMFRAPEGIFFGAFLSQETPPLQVEWQTEPRRRPPFEPYHATSVPRGEDLESHAQDLAADSTRRVTTLMLRNIPNRYSQQTLLKEVNAKGFNGTYDFFYLPMDVRNRGNVGYAFINFVNQDAAARFRVTFSDHPFRLFSSRKIATVCDAFVQGLENNLRHFENRVVTQARNDQYRPVIFHGGRRVCFEDALATARAADPAAVPPAQRPTADATRTRAPTPTGRGRGCGAAGAADTARHAHDAAQPLKVMLSDAIPSNAAWVSDSDRLDARVDLEAAVQRLLSNGSRCHASSTLGDSATQSLQGSRFGPGPGVFTVAEEQHLNAGEGMPAYINLQLARSEAAIGAGEDVPAYIDLKAGMPEVPLPLDIACPAEPDPATGDKVTTPRTRGLHLPAVLGQVLYLKDVPKLPLAQGLTYLTEPDPAISDAGATPRTCGLHLPSALGDMLSLEG